jgi:hypothetical protein
MWLTRKVGRGQYGRTVNIDYLGQGYMLVFCSLQLKIEERSI